MYNTSKFATNTQEIEPMELEHSVSAAPQVRETEARRRHSSTTLLISVNGVPLRNFSKSTVTHAKLIGHVSQTTHLLGVICHPFGKTMELKP